MKKCYKCKKSFSGEQMTKNKHTRDGLGSYCKKCQKLEHDRYVFKNKESSKKYAAKYYLEKTKKKIPQTKQTS